MAATTTEISFDLLKTWLAANKNTSKINLRINEDAIEEVKTNGWKSQAIEPATPLSCILYLTDPMYVHIPTTSRPSILREKCTELESSFTSILKGRQFPVRRTAEAIIAASTGGSDSCSTLGWNALCRLFECQIVWFDEGTKLLQFYPSDVCEWEQEKPIYFISCLANQVWITPEGWNQGELGVWLANKEADGWRVKYEEADGTMEELKELASKIGFNMSVKVNKAELQKQLGRAKAVKHLATWE